MMFPSVFGENLFDDWMDDFGFRDNFFSGKNPLYGKHAKNIMKTDVRETDKGYELDVDLTAEGWLSYHLRCQGS